MEALEHHGVLIALATFVVGGLFAFIANYVKFMKEFGYIKGQLSQLLEMHEDVSGLIEKHAKLERDFTKAIKDLDKAFVRIKLMEAKLLNGGMYGTSS